MCLARNNQFTRAYTQKVLKSLMAGVRNVDQKWLKAGVDQKYFKDGASDKVLFYIRVTSYNFFCRNDNLRWWMGYDVMYNKCCLRK